VRFMDTWPGDPWRTPKGVAGALGEAVEAFGQRRPYRSRKVRIPDLIGLTARDAEDALMRLGLRWRFVLLVNPPPPVMGQVVDQEPQAGTKVRRKRAVVMLTLMHEPDRGPLD
jgi:hypothetical protein